MKRRLFLLLSVLVLLFFAQPALAYLQTGEPAPDFALVDAAGKTVRLSDYRGRVVVLKLATTWCPTCKEQSKEIESVAEVLNAGEVVVLDVFLQDTQEMVDAYLSKQNKVDTFVSVLDDGQVRDSYNVYLIPRLLLVDRQQKVRRDGELMLGHDLKKQVQSLLDEPSEPAAAGAQTN
jgi:peroxiredoxin